MVGMKSEVGYQYMQEQHLFDRLLVEAVRGIALSLIFHITVRYSTMAITFNSEAILRLFFHTYTEIHKICMFFS